MIKLPFERYVILTTLDFDEMIQRLSTVIYDPYFSSSSNLTARSQRHRYLGRVGGCKFLATRIIGHKHFHLPLLLCPTIVGNINPLAHSHGVSLDVNLQNSTFILLLARLGGLITASSVVVDKIYLNLRDDIYSQTLLFSLLLYLATIVYLYLRAWRTTRFFKQLFAQRLRGISRIDFSQQPSLATRSSQFRIHKSSSLD